MEASQMAYHKKRMLSLNMFLFDRFSKRQAPKHAVAVKLSTKCRRF